MHTITPRRRTVGVALLAGVVVALLPLPASAQRVQSNVVLVRPDDVVDEDLYAAGNTIVISGVVKGDLVAFALDSIRIDGVVEGDVVALSTSVEITGRVGGAVRVGGGSVVVEGDVGDDLVVVALTAQTGSASTVGRDVLAWGRTVELLGSVGRDIEGTHTRTRIAGSVAGDIGITTSALALLPGLQVDGDVRYVADDGAVVSDAASIDGNLIRAEALAANLRVRGVRLLVQILGALGALGLGIGLLWAAPERSLAAGEALRRRPVASLAWGVGVVSVPLALLIVAAAIVSLTSLSSSGPLVLVLVPVALALGSVVMLGMLTTPVPVALVTGSRLRPDWSPYARFVLGFPVLIVAWLLPWVGVFIVLALAVAGLGSWLVAVETPD